MKKKYPSYNPSDQRAVELAGPHIKELEDEARALIEALGLNPELLANVTHALCCIFLAEEGVRNLQLPPTELLAQAKRQMEGVEAAVLAKALGLNRHWIIRVEFVWHRIRSERGETVEAFEDDGGMAHADRNTFGKLVTFVGEELDELDDADDEAGLTVVVAEALRECGLGIGDYSATVREALVDHFSGHEWDIAVENLGTDEEQLVFTRKPYVP
ncbi:MAG: hypothetical protein A2700_00180 [Candidatus Blackburnbacteria bacterium RIFCSPHIGHO2_01_FULL_44_64]|uniref:Uncharacterized protein n=1 Tax=Candidatus Blackburnbacteria bacterium RIFCSPHIGHO2_02_FULL_44_20 TaxID=1797516 RepID=A0A1G1V802_9BACT|nr:MAG: hypothetical protein A2700_00180 [Candidatus Blackburnbacteria bacterium RIFCSPHIGHO2_01_FULL_44_64]OGY11160.1 MAG: hypothetical protein A3E16_01330 [Candidatus Blackburnbacteria bacterium RIFCSPHIGHO2_12_FULL_44_25]OGY11555.1 MAG: hypothetical protein A3D26_03325 [Candidatus Blackburnbacteria bacterium RIFCSPHIGHO2_02_FULL_44_20]OGY14112.1 MAG: hypothetical protein A3A62_01990 [Candidatus Blackburnbacteria bacterium RIFCSPLOWO2_01_FULL_44_43]OGY15770.1 MAG: hypothetical protein A3H88_0